MNFDTSNNSVVTNLDRFDVGNVYRDDPEKLQSDLIGIKAISLEDAMEVIENNSPKNNIKSDEKDVKSSNFLKHQVIKKLVYEGLKWSFSER